VVAFVPVYKLEVFSGIDRFSTLQDFVEFFENDIEVTLNLKEAELLIDSVFSRLNAVHQKITDPLPQNMMVVARHVRVELPNMVI
jgi:hypothetical protein